MKESKIAWLLVLGSLVVGCVGCGADNDGGQNKVTAGGAAGSKGEDTDPTILGVDSQMRQEMRSMIAQFIKENSVPGDPDENLKKAMDSAMAQVRRPADAFGIKPDSVGNLSWPDTLKEEIIDPLRAQFDSGELFDAHKIDLPVWATSLLDEYKSGTITPVRRELLFILATAPITARMS